LEQQGLDLQGNTISNINFSTTGTTTAAGIFQEFLFWLVINIGSQRKHHWFHNRK
jgi:hypothetical protein